MVTNAGAATAKARKQPKRPGTGKPHATVKFGSAVVPIYRTTSGGRTRFTISYHRDGKRMRQIFSKLDAAKKEARLVAQRIQAGQQHVTDLKAHERDAYVTAARLLEDLDMPLVAAVQEYVRARKVLGETPLVAAAEEFTRRTRGIKLGVKVGEVVEELLEAKKQDGVSERYILQLQSNLRRFAAAFDLPITHVQRDQIDDWLRERDLKPRSRNSLLATVRVLFSFARKRSYLPANEKTEAEAVDKVKAPDVETAIFTPEEFRKILHAAPPHLIPILAIGGFAGMRKAEMNRLDWNAVNLGRRIIEVRAGQAKTASRRLIPITDNLTAWLDPLPRTGAVVPDIDLHRQTTALARKIGVEWPNNVLRHSFISYRIAKVKSAEQVALEAGNSPAIIFKHYRELATEEQADAWFGILPKEGQLDNKVEWDRFKRKLTIHDEPSD
ncbi:MAG: hypothetical protein HKN82_15880 [Akkermansiaceae bacterium]|nr:hypothetical protein [Akkermansiaceae bacterium]